MHKTRITIASASDRETIYRLRHAVYAMEIGQHIPNAEERLTDALDQFNVYIVATVDDQIIGFVSITPPGHGTFSVDKYFSRAELSPVVNETTYEVRLLTVLAGERCHGTAQLLMYAAFRWVAEQRATQIVAIGRIEIRGVYQKAGLRMLGLQAIAGTVSYELMSATIPELRHHALKVNRLLRRLEPGTQWDIGFPYFEEVNCEHGGASFAAIGSTFQSLQRSAEVVNADVLDAWFPPAPGAIQAVQQHLPWLLKTSPPAGCEGLVDTIAQVRGVPASSLVVGAGSSSLIYLAFREWLSPRSRVLLLDPTYGEYSHVLEQVVGCRPDRFPLSQSDEYRVDVCALLARLQQSRYDVVVLVNPNNPTGHLIPRRALQSLIAGAPGHTRMWIDEAYIDYAGGTESVETVAALSDNTIVCKSLSKVYALSGARAAYLCGPSAIVSALRRLTPPWAVGLPSQVAAVAALQDPGYHALRYRETAELRTALAAELRAAIPSIQIVEGVANFILCLLPPGRVDAATVIEYCRTRDVFIRDVRSMGCALGDHAIRIAVKDAAGNRRIVEAVAAVVEP